MAPPTHDEGTIMTNVSLSFDTLHNTYCLWPGLKAWPTLILVNLYDIRRNREAEIKEENNDVIAVLSALFSKALAYKVKIDILKERGFQVNDVTEMEMGNMGSWNKEIFESMRDDLRKEVKKEVAQEVREKAIKEKEKEMDDINHVLILMNEGKSEEEICNAHPNLSLESIRKLHQTYVKIRG